MLGRAPAKRPYGATAAVTNGLVTGYNNSSSVNLVASFVSEELDQFSKE